MFLVGGGDGTPNKRAPTGITLYSADVGVQLSFTVRGYSVVERLWHAMELLLDDRQTGTE